MGEVPRARNTAQNTLTTWHADRLYGAMVITTVIEGGKGGQYRELYKLLQIKGDDLESLSQGTNSEDDGSDNGMDE